MKEKIKHFSKGDFQINKPDIILSETNILCKIGEGEIYHGSFMIENQSDGDIRGLVYPSSFRMQCKKQGFEGNQVVIEFQFDGRGLKPGYVENGVFAIACNGGEFEVGFSAIIEKPFVMSNYGKIQDLRGFKKLAYRDYEEAKKIFKSREFYEIIKYDQQKIRNLYDNMRKWNLDAQGMEEFLVGIKQKEKIFLTLDMKERLYKNLDGMYSDSIQITKNTWGYLNIQISTDCDFLEPSISNLSTLDFNGMSYDLRYEIKSNKLHAGRNFGHIIIKTEFDEIYFLVEIDNERDSVGDKRQEEYIMAYLMKTSLRLEAGHISSEKWIEKATNLINELQGIDSENTMYKLLQAHAYIRIGQLDEAKWILETYNYSKFPIGRDLETDAYYLYLSSIQRKESAYSKKVVEDLQRLYLKNPKSWKILCMLVEIDPYYNDYYEKKHALENQFNLGANHIPLYLTAYKCFKDKPTNLKRLGEFEIQILRFAIKYELLTQELALYTANLAGQQKNFDIRILEILEKSYNLFQDSMILTSICTILIKGNETNKKYFKWYELGIQEDIKIAKLYEYYMESIDVERDEPIHRTVLLYFAHGNSLHYDKIALLYANLISNEKEDSDLYKYYIDAIKVFTMQQLEMRRINKNLRVLYRKFLSEKEMNTEKIKAIYDITHSYQVTTKVKNLKFVLVISSDGGIYQKVPYNEHTGSQVILDSKDDIVAWESKDGQYYVGSIKYNTNRLFNESKYIEMCKNKLNLSMSEVSEEEKQELTFELLKELNLDYVDEEKAFNLCIKRLKSDGFIESPFMTYALFKLFKKEEYDKNSLQYLSSYFNGSSRDMKEIWHAAVDYGVTTDKISERIITQMLFSEVLCGEDEIFEDYYSSGAYFRLIDAYVVYVCREHVIKNKILTENTIEIIMRELHQKPEIADVVKISMLKYFATHTYTKEQMVLLKLCMQELCEKQLYFEFYLNYGEEWLREVQLWDKTLVTYTSKLGGKVKLIYQLQSEDKESVEYEDEVLLPIYENLFVKKFLVFKNEVLRYYFKETLGEVTIKSEKKEYRLDQSFEMVGKYGRLNSIISSPDKRHEMMTSYALEEMLAAKMFVPYD